MIVIIGVHSECVHVCGWEGGGGTQAHITACVCDFVCEPLTHLGDVMMSMSTTGQPGISMCGNPSKSFIL